LLYELSYVVATALVKLSIAFFLLRFIIKPAQKYIVYGMLTIIIMFSTFLFFFALFQCRPVSNFWRRVVNPHGSCDNPKSVIDATYAHAAIVSMGDWTLGILPIFIVWDSGLNLRTKLYVAVILALGSM
jgi:hypothetical protein